MQNAGLVAPWQIESLGKSTFSSSRLIAGPYQNAFTVTVFVTVVGGCPCIFCNASASLAISRLCMEARVEKPAVTEEITPNIIVMMLKMMTPIKVQR